MGRADLETDDIDIVAIDLLDELHVQSSRLLHNSFQFSPVISILRKCFTGLKYVQKWQKND